MSPARYAHPEWVALVVGVACGAAAAVALARVIARRRRRVLLGSPDRIGGDLRADAVLLGAALAVGVALVGPRFGERELRVPASGVDVVFAIDVSRSMDARDVPPSRLDRARRDLGDMLDRLAEADRAALAAFAGRGVLLTPLTPDHQALRELASGLDTDLVRPSSSDLGSGIHAALEAFEPASERPRVVFVLSDGEDPQRRPDVGVAEAVRRQVRVLTAAIGGEAGAIVPDHGVPLVDRSGRVVVSRRDRERLRALADATDGAFFEGDRFGRIDADAAVAAIRRDAGDGPGDTVVRRVRAVQVAPFAALAFGLLLLEALPVTRVRARGAAGLALLVLAAPPGVRTATAQPQDPPPAAAPASEREIADALRERPGDPVLLNAVGIARLERGRREDAARAFLAASVAASDPDASATALFNLGVTALEGGELEAARDAFFDALALEPDDARSRFNLEWTLRALEAQPPPLPDAPSPEAKAPPPDEPEDAEQREHEDAERPSRPQGAQAEAAPLDPERLEQRLRRIEDDPRAALRAAAGAAGARAGRGGVAGW